MANTQDTTITKKDYQSLVDKCLSLQSNLRNLDHQLNNCTFRLQSVQEQRLTKCWFSLSLVELRRQTNLVVRLMFELQSATMGKSVNTDYYKYALDQLCYFEFLWRGYFVERILNMNNQFRDYMTKHCQQIKEGKQKKRLAVEDANEFKKQESLIKIMKDVQPSLASVNKGKKPKSKLDLTKSDTDVKKVDSSPSEQDDSKKGSVKKVGSKLSAQGVSKKRSKKKVGSTLSVQGVSKKRSKKKVGSTLSVQDDSKKGSVKKVGSTLSAQDVSKKGSVKKKVVRKETTESIKCPSNTDESSGKIDEKTAMLLDSEDREAADLIALGQLEASMRVNQQLMECIRNHISMARATVLNIYDTGQRSLHTVERTSRNVAVTKQISRLGGYTRSIIYMLLIVVVAVIIVALITNLNEIIELFDRLTTQFRPDKSDKPNTPKMPSELNEPDVLNNSTKITNEATNEASVG